MLSALFIASLIVGLLLGVYFISTGVERERPGGDTRVALPLPASAAFLTVLGLLGYLRVRKIRKPERTISSLKESAQVLTHRGRPDAPAELNRHSLPR